MTISSNQTAFTAYDVTIKPKTKEEIKQDKISFNNEVIKTNEIENIAYHTTINNNETISTVFTDPTNGKYVITSMTIEVLDKLKKQFGEDNIIPKEDGTIQLRNKAEEFVSAWYADIAYTRKFLKSDENNDGFLSDEEILNVKNTIDFDMNKTNVIISKSYDTITKKELELTKITFPNMPVSLDDELNMTLKFDSDFDGKISLKEVIVSFGEVIKSLPREDIKNLNIDNFDLSIDDMDKILSIMEYISKLFLEIELEKKMMKMLDNSFLKKELDPEQMAKISSEELFEFLTQKDGKSENKKENNDPTNTKKQEKKSSDNIDNIKDLILKL